MLRLQVRADHGNGWSEWADVELLRGKGAAHVPVDLLVHAHARKVTVHFDDFRQQWRRNPSHATNPQ